MNHSQGMKSKNTYNPRQPPAVNSSSIRANMNAGITELNMGGDIAAKKAKRRSARIEASNEDEKTVVQKRKSKKTKKHKATATATAPAQCGFQQFDPLTVDKNAFMIVIASRRSGKSHLITHMLNEYTKKNKVDGIFLFSKTNAGFDGIPSTYRYQDLDILPQIVDTQLKVKKHNVKAKKKDIINSNIIIILDDMIGEGGMSQAMRTNKMLNKLAVNGRHLSHGEHSNMMVIMISQVFTAISPTIRLNTDFLLTTKLTARRERENIVNSFLSLNSGRKALAASYECFDSIVNAADFQFIAIATTKPNKTKFSDYIFTYKAPAKLKEKKLTGKAADWKYNKRKIVF